MKVFLTAFLLPITLFSQTTVLFNNTSLPIKDKIITCIKTDKNGTNWIGTLNGLFCHNGENWIKTTTKNSKLPSNSVLCIEIKDNIKYIGTTEGLLIIDKQWNVYNKENSSLPTNKIRSIKAISEGVVWIATSQGLVRYKEKFQEILSTKKNGINDDDFLSLNIDKEKVVWAGTNKGLYSYKDKIWRVYTTKNSQIPDNYIWQITIDSENKKWIGTKNGIGILFENKWTFYNKKNTPISKNRIKAITNDDYDRIWVATEKEVVSYDGKKWKKHKTHNKKEKINNFYIDFFDNKWICLYDKTVIYNLEGVEFKNNIKEESIEIAYKK